MPKWIFGWCIAVNLVLDGVLLASGWPWVGGSLILTTLLMTSAAS